MRIYLSLRFNSEKYTFGQAAGWILKVKEFNAYFQEIIGCSMNYLYLFSFVKIMIFIVNIVYPIVSFSSRKHIFGNEIVITRLAMHSNMFYS